jgi:ferric-dicitrate binding protein FerR (iron transport regulator)
VKDGDQPALPEYNTLVTPRGRQQELQLADGSRVWLNAQSSIRFPSTFPGSTREVTITGEAYFEVAKNPQKPFIVHVNNSSIEVLGTHFNVMAYNNEPAMATTLLEGAIAFHSNNQNLTLRPGQQSRLLSNGKLVLIPDADTDLAVAWKNGLQAFDQADLKTIMRQVGRWYDVDIEFVGDLAPRTFSGGIPRSANLSQLLQLFKATNIHFKIDAENKKLTVIP